MNENVFYPDSRPLVKDRIGSFPCKMGPIPIASIMECHPPIPGWPFTMTMLWSQPLPTCWCPRVDSHFCIYLDQLISVLVFTLSHTHFVTIILLCILDKKSLYIKLCLACTCMYTRVKTTKDLHTSYQQRVTYNVCVPKLRFHVILFLGGEMNRYGAEMSLN